VLPPPQPISGAGRHHAHERRHGAGRRRRWHLHRRRVARRRGPDDGEGADHGRPARRRLAGIETACESADVDPADVGRFRHATTAAVNALLEGAGAETALVTTAGFGDVLEIGRQDRPALYDLDARKPDPPVPAERRFEVDERATVDGIERPVDEDEIRTVADEISESGDVEAVAVAFLHAYAHPHNERRAAEILDQELDAAVSASHEVLAAFREYERTQ